MSVESSVVCKCSGIHTGGDCAVRSISAGGRATSCTTNPRSGQERFFRAERSMRRFLASMVGDERIRRDGENVVSGLTTAEQLATPPWSPVANRSDVWVACARANRGAYLPRLFVFEPQFLQRL